jgi:hypothetical protein
MAREEGPNADDRDRDQERRQRLARNEPGGHKQANLGHQHHRRHDPGATDDPADPEPAPVADQVRPDRDEIGVERPGDDAARVDGHDRRVDRRASHAEPGHPEPY